MINSLLVVNPTSGKVEIKSFLFELLSSLSLSERKIEILFLDKEKRIEDYLEGKEEVICCGGDGTLNSTINAIIKSEKDIKIGYIPCGSTNDFARGVGLSSNLRSAAEVLISGKEREIDIGLWNNEKAFSYVASFGAFSKVSYTTPQELKNFFGHFAYILNGIADVVNIKSFKIKAETESEIIEDEYCFGAVLNSTSLAGIVKLKETLVDLSDGLFEVILIKKPKNIIELNDLIFSLSGSSFASPLISFFKCKKCIFEFEEEIDWSLDGEEQKGKRRVEVENKEKRVKIILPELEKES